MPEAREMTLDEWCAQLPPHHLANRELRAMRDAAREQERDLANLRGLLAECLALNPHVVGDMEKVRVWADVSSRMKAAARDATKENDDAECVDRMAGERQAADLLLTMEDVLANMVAAAGHEDYRAVERIGINALNALDATKGDDDA